MGGKIPRRIKKDLSKKVTGATEIIFFLDYDGTLTSIRKKPAFAGIDKNTKNLLKKLAGKSWSRIFIISGRTLKDIKNLIGLESLCYSGNHGIELEGPRLKYLHPTAKTLRPHIQKAYAVLRKKLKIKGIILENKFYTLGVHYRLVPRGRVPELRRIFNATVKDLRRNKKIKVVKGKKVLEVRPDIQWDKGKIVSLILRRIKRKNTLPIYIGDDITDEDAFRSLGAKGVSILVSKRRKKTSAQYRLNSSKEVIDFLKWVLRMKQ